MDFKQKLAKAVKNNDSLLCVGLDSDAGKSPSCVDQLTFNKQIIEQTYDLVCAYKPNSAFYEPDGAEGIGALKATCDYLRKKHPEIPIILGFKRGDIGNTNYLEPKPGTLLNYLYT